jgi:hypothetical protein
MVQADPGMLLRLVEVYGSRRLWAATKSSTAAPKELVATRSCLLLFPIDFASAHLPSKPIFTRWLPGSIGFALKFSGHALARLAFFV